MLTIQQLVAESHATAVEHGWWEEVPNIPEKLALIHSEVSEALEDFRAGSNITCLYADPDYGASHYAESLTRSQIAPADKMPKPCGFPSELADILIRIGDLCGHYGIDLEEALVAKMAYNKTRAYRHGGKTC